MARKKAKVYEAEVKSFNHDGRGVAHVDGQTAFINGALPGERVRFIFQRRKKSWGDAFVVEHLNFSEKRIEAPCQHFDQCGGCSVQYLEPADQLAFKQDTLVDAFVHIGRFEKDSLPLDSPISGPAFHYRRKARLGMRYDHKKARMFAGFRKKRSGQVVDTAHCLILARPADSWFETVQNALGRLSNPDRLPQLEVAVGDNGSAVVLRHLEPLNEEDLAILDRFEKDLETRLYLQPGNEKTIHRHREKPPAGGHKPGGNDDLYYTIDGFELKMYFAPWGFIQVNADINNKMIQCAIDWLALESGDRLVDLFSGLGNLSLPAAGRCARVTASDCSEDAIEWGRYNARVNGLSNVEFACMDLQNDLLEEGETLPVWWDALATKLLIDPPRSGALEVVRNLEELQRRSRAAGGSGLERIVYISCNPSTLARDARLLVDQGFRLEKVRVMDMFPHTGHVEAMALFRAG